MKSEIKQKAQEHLDYLSNLFSISDVELHVEESPDKVIPEEGVCGRAPDSNNIYVYFDSNNENAHSSLDEKIKSTVAHEFHHACRHRYFDWEIDTLLGSMITEGLADNFDIEINGGEPNIWSTALKEDEIEEYLKLAKPELHSKDFNYLKWFFGTEDVPRWAGYPIGFYLVKKYLDKTGKKASECFSEPADNFYHP